jgi:alkylhydroperoxidase family enzyme
MEQARISPLAPPYAPDVDGLLDSLRFGRPEPIALFRTLAHAPRVLARIQAGGLLDRGPVPLRLRELAILRTTARCGASYEWGVHVATFRAKAGFTDAEIAATTTGTHEWAEAEALVIALADALHDHSKIDDALFAKLSKAFATDVLLELVSLVGFYHLISFQVNVLRLGSEPGAPSLP